MTNLFFRIRLILPYIVAILIVLVASLPFGVTGFNAFRPLVLMMLIFHFSIYRPHYFPYYFLFILGVLHDAATGIPLGITSLLLILLKACIVSVRTKYVRVSMTVIWVQFSLWILAIACIEWIMMSFFYGQILSVTLACIQLLLSVSIYPLFHKLFVWVNRMTPRAAGEDKIIIPIS